MLVTTALHSEIICFPQLPLAVYREIAAHVQQIAGVTATLFAPTFTEFDYYNSQVGGIELSFNDDFAPGDRQIIEEILAFYANRYGTPERQPAMVSSYTA
ncbi:hypothetical protein D082_07910 [Synechocystis sp. PCC 6714]|nr:hypothetical protein D082_07910 [Synechocystis sp. PCC 6714]